MATETGTTDPQELSVAELREQLAETLNEVRYTKTRRLVTRHGRKVAAVVSVEDLRLLEALEDIVDIRIARERLANLESEGTVSWETLQKELELDKDAQGKTAQVSGKRTRKTSAGSTGKRR
ncbi:MAG: type II toxin-antitoxin system Phd/YefM family antitoxin [Proteobacteria bacterium]|nr:type II toxin-antitoxin system Phd/YefM family antitoxin [Pseudomonadota bacterium]